MNEILRKSIADDHKQNALKAKKEGNLRMHRLYMKLHKSVMKKI